MTRWARGGCANRKKPLDATEWTELSDARSNANTVSAVQRKRATKQSSLPKFKHKLNNKQKVGDQSNRSLRQNVADELEKQVKESSSTSAGDLPELIMMEEFVHKDARREARRLKRQEQKQRSRVSLPCCMYDIHRTILELLHVQGVQENCTKFSAP